MLDLRVIFTLAFLLSSSSIAYGDCPLSEFKVCTKVRSVMEVMKKDTGLCDVILEEIDRYPTTKFVAWKASFQKCPNLSKNEFVFVKFACNDLGGVPPAPDKLMILGDEECSMLPNENLQRVTAIAKKIKPGTNLKELLKYRLNPKGMRSKASEGEYYFHSVPAVSVTVHVKRIGNGKAWDCEKDLELCSITKIDPPRQSFILAGECERAKKKDSKIECREIGEI